MIFDECKVSIWLAYLSLIYILASAYYLMITQFYGTPLKDELKKHPDLLKIKENSAKKRKFAFYFGLIIAGIACYYFRPFHKCMKSSTVPVPSPPQPSLDIPMNIPQSNLPTSIPPPYYSQLRS